MQFAPRAINFTYYAGIVLDALARVSNQNRKMLLFAVSVDFHTD